MVSKLTFAFTLISTLLPYFAVSQLVTVPTTCTTSAGCASQCCVINRQTSKIFGVATGSCAATQPIEGQACNENCACVAGSVCTNNILCPRCGKICMATDVYNRLVSYYNTGCSTNSCFTTYGHKGGSRAGKSRSLALQQFSGVHDLPTLA